MRLVIIESPYAGDIETNIAYARAAMRDSIMRGEAPYASHLLYTQPGILDDKNTAERAGGIERGLLWGRAAEATVVYHDLGISSGMKVGIARANQEGRPVEYRSLTDRPIPAQVEPKMGIVPLDKHHHAYLDATHRKHPDGSYFK